MTQGRSQIRVNSFDSNLRENASYRIIYGEEFSFNNLEQRSQTKILVCSKDPSKGRQTFLFGFADLSSSVFVLLRNAEMDLPIGGCDPGCG